MTATPVQLLVGAQEVIRDPKNWTKGEAFRNSRGAAVTDVEVACKFCAVGALRAASVRLNLDEGATEACQHATALLRDCVPDLPCFMTADQKLVTLFNDHPSTTHSAIMALFDTAIRKAKS